jgi:hypothetical protein
MAMTTPWERFLAAYRPLYLRGRWLDGRHDLPVADQSAAVEERARRTRRRGLPTTLAHMVFHLRSKP